MKKLAGILFCFLLLAIPSLSQIETPFLGFYWIMGEIKESPGRSFDGQKIYFANKAAWDIIGEKGASGQPGRFLINAYLAGVPLLKGAKYQIFTEKLGGYGVGPYETTISGRGFEVVGPVPILAGGGVSDVRAVALAEESSPRIKVWFGRRSYQKGLVEKGEDFITGSQPEIRIRAEIAEPYALSSNSDDYRITVDEGQVATRTYKIADLKADLKTAEGTITWPDKLEPGKHTFKIRAKSSGARAAAAEGTETCIVTVLGGPLRIVGAPLVNPSPFNPETNKEVTIQYTLSQDANIDIFIFNVAAEIVKKISIAKGEEGGLAQLNKVKWDGATEQGGVVGSGIYLGNLVARDELKILGKFKLVVYR